jgi:dCMP deaminase
VAIKGATLYVTLQPCFVCIKLLATAQIKGVYFELAYGSEDAARDEFWKNAVAAAGFEVFKPLAITPGALEFILPSLTEITSRRRLAATAAAEEPHFVGAVESE